jgi:Rrf2 family iron-sulfur cluster assembly transcriptional regulator
VRISSKGKIAVKALICMRRMREKLGQTYVPVYAMVSETGISQCYLEQVFRKLRIGGVVRASRGPSGGYALSRSSGSIFLSDIVRAVDDRAHEECGEVVFDKALDAARCVLETHSLQHCIDLNDETADS